MCRRWGFVKSICYCNKFNYTGCKINQLALEPGRTSVLVCQLGICNKFELFAVLIHLLPVKVENHRFSCAFNLKTICGKLEIEACHLLLCIGFLMKITGGLLMLLLATWSIYSEIIKLNVVSCTIWWRSLCDGNLNSIILFLCKIL